MILITGARGLLGSLVHQECLNNGFDCLAVSRQAAQGFVKWDIEQGLINNKDSWVKEVRVLIHCAPIWLLPNVLDTLDKECLDRVIAFSSTSITGKQHTDSAKEKALIFNLQSGEDNLKSVAQQFRFTYNIIRPSMIYGYGRDQNVAHLARFIKRWRLSVLVGDASGIRQPVHVDDLVSAVFSMLSGKAMDGKTYTLAGAEMLSYDSMVKRIFSGLGYRPIIIRLPRYLMRFALTIAESLTKFGYTPDMADRMMQDLTYSNEEASNDFGYSPQKFLQNTARDLP